MGKPGTNKNYSAGSGCDPLELRVPAECAGLRLDQVLARLLPAHSRSRLARWVRESRVAVDGEPAAPRAKMWGGERLRVEPGPDPEKLAHLPQDIPLSIVYEDDALLVVDKPAGVVVHPARGHHSGTLVQALAGRAAGGQDPWRPGIVHRLDRDTSGLLVVAKSEEAHRRLRALLSDRRIEREYLALVEGRPPARTGTIDAPLGRDRRARTRMSVDTDVPRAAVTHFSVERALPGATLLRVRLETGRTHQIRAHLQAIGHPVAGDPEYGRPGLFGLERQFLHSTRLAFDHPLTGERIEVSSPLPADLAAALDVAAAAKPA